MIKECELKIKDFKKRKSLREMKDQFFFPQAKVANEYFKKYKIYVVATPAVYIVMNWLSIFAIEQLIYRCTFILQISISI